MHALVFAKWGRSWRLLAGVIAAGALVLLVGCMGNVGGEADTASTYRWSQQTPDEPHPPSRIGACAVFDGDLDQILVFGGIYLGPTSEPETHLNDLWSYDPATSKWTELKPMGDVPVPGDLQLGVYAGRTKQFLVYGGLGENSHDTGRLSRL